MSSNNSYNKEFTSDNNDVESGNVIENVVSESDDNEVNYNSESERVMVCKGVETNVDQLEREYEETVEVEGWQRVKFFRGVKGGEERSSRMYWVEKWSTNNCFLNFCIVPGGIRKCFNVAVPSAWSERENVTWRWGERYLEKELCVDGEIQIFKSDRGYKELIERLGWEKINYMKCLPYEMKTDDYVDSTAVNEENLPDVVLEIVNEYDDINDRGITKNTDGDCRKLTNVDKVYEIINGDNPINYNGITNDIDLMGYNNNNNNKLSVSKDDNHYIKVRLMYDDGG